MDDMTRDAPRYDPTAYPEAGFRRKLKFILKYHLHVMLYCYFWLGLFVCGLVAPDDRIAELGSDLISAGWHLSLLSALLVLPVPVVYLIRMRRSPGPGKAG